MLARFFMMIGSLNYLSNVLFNVGLQNFLPSTVMQLIIMTIGLSGLYVGFNRDYYLPFLGECAIPIKDISPFPKSEKTQIYKLTGLPPNAKVIYWGAQPSETPVSNPFDAYGTYANSGSDITNGNGELEINLETPAEYSVRKYGMEKRLRKHLHYRYELPQYKGMYSRISTIYL